MKTNVNQTREPETFNLETTDHRKEKVERAAEKRT